MEWFLYDNGLRHERVNYFNYEKEETIIVHTSTQNDVKWSDIL